MVEYLPIFMFATLLVLILTGFPVAFTLAGTALIFGCIGAYTDVFMWSDFGFLPGRIWGIVGNFTLLAIPLFIFMGLVLEKSGIAEGLLHSGSQVLRKFRGSLNYSVIIVGALLAASTGIVGATVVTMGVLALPTMLSHGYDKKISCGTIAASGTLGQIIPPSIVLVLLGDIMNVDVGDLFIGALLPGALLVGLYLAYVFIRIKLNPDLAPELIKDQSPINWPSIAKTMIPPGLLVFVVLGSILGGIASPTEAAACGAVGALVIVYAKGIFTRYLLHEVATQTAKISAMVFTILIGAQFFSIVFRGMYGDELITDFVNDFGGSNQFIFLFIMILMFLLGFFLDFIEICFIIIPIVQPILAGLGYDLLLVAILIALNLQTSFLTPPFGFALFYLKGVAPKEVKTSDIYKGVAPFVIIQAVAILIVWTFPSLVLWLPQQVFN